MRNRRRSFLARYSEDTLKSLKEIAEKKDTSVANLLREGVEFVIAKYK